MNRKWMKIAEKILHWAVALAAMYGAIVLVARALEPDPPPKPPHVHRI